MHHPRIVTTLSLVAILGACQTNPYTGRQTVNLLSEQEEASLGEQAYAETKAKEKPHIITSGAQFDQVQRVAKAIANASDDLARKRGEKPSFQWECILIDSPQVNAWCLPGGKMGVYTGILPVTQTDAGLAVVLGHEVAHAVSRHGGRRVTEGMLTEYAQQAVAAGFSSSSPTTQTALMQAMGMGSQLAVALPFSRTDESEADHVGLILMASAGYDPKEAPKFWQRMSSKAGGSAPPEFLSTHPSDETRIQNLNKWIPEAEQYYKTGAPR